MRHSKRLHGFAHTVVVLGLAHVVLFAFAPPARANLVINATFGSLITGDPNAALIEATINQAVSFYEASITTPITVNITYNGMGSGLGQSSTFFGGVPYSQYLAALQTHSSGDPVDTAALASLPGGLNNPVDGDPTVDVTTANLRALGFTASVSTDSTIGLNTAITNYAGKLFNSGFYSLLAVVEHETDEALGLGSNLDSNSVTGDIRPEDLFRYSAPGTRSYTLNPSAISYFSVDGGVTNLIRFNQSGGGADYGDWASSATPHVQDAFGTPGASPVIGVELTALDAIGYNFASPVPEPYTWFLVLGAIGFLGYRRRAAR